MRPGLVGHRRSTPPSSGPPTYIEKSIDNLTLALIIGLRAARARAARLLLRVARRAGRASSSIAAVAHDRGARALRRSATTFNAIVLAGLAVALGVVDRRRGRRASRTSRGGCGERAARGATSRRGDGRSTPSLEVAQPARLRDADRRCWPSLPVFFIERLTGAFFRPAGARPIALAVVASMVGRADGHAGAERARCCSRRQPERRESPLARVARSALRRGARARRRRAALGVRRRRRVVAARRRSAPSRCYGPSLLPSFKDTRPARPLDGHAGHVAAGDGPDHGRASASCGRSPACATSAAHVGRAVTGDQVGRRQLRRALGQHRPGADYDATHGRGRARRRRLPGLSQRASLTYSQRAGATSARSTAQPSERRRRARLRRGPRRPRARKARGGPRRPIAGVDGVVGARRSAAAREQPTVAGRGRPRQGRSATASSPATSAAPRPRCCRASRSAASSSSRRSSTWWSGARPTRDSLTSVRRPADRHARRRPRAPRRRRRRADRARARRSSSATPSRAASTSAPTCAAAASGAVVRRRPATASQALTFPLEYHAEVLGDADGAADCGVCSASRSRPLIGIFLLLQAAFGSWRLAALVVPHAAARRSSAACSRRSLDGGTLSLGALVGAARRVRDRGAQRRPARRPLPRARARTRARPSGRPRAARRTRAARPGRDRRRWPRRSSSLPFAGPGPAPGCEIVHPMAVVVLGGLVTSTLLSLFVLPVAVPARSAARVARRTPAELTAVLDELARGSRGRG